MHLDEGLGVCGYVGVHPVHHADPICMIRDVGNQFAEPCAAVAVAGEVEGEPIGFALRQRPELSDFP